MAAAYGLSPISRRRLPWEISRVVAVKPQPASEPRRRTPDPRDDLRALMDDAS